jgi:hypothetical protein
MGARNRGGIGLSYRPARLHRLAEFNSLESVPGLHKLLKIRALVYRINGQYQVKAGTYLVGTPEIQLGTILNEGGWEGDFFHRLIVSPFLKRQGPTDSRQPL